MKYQTTHQPSVLYSQNPYGVGTPNIESLDSYTHRLAQKHRVPRHRIDLLVTMGHSEVRRPNRVQDHSILDGPTFFSSNFAAKLSELTRRPLVGRLGLGSLAGVISQQGARRQVRAWCSKCFNNSLTRGEESYWPLLWSLQAYERCHIHDELLQCTCPSCGMKQLTKKPWAVNLNTCPNCLTVLHDLAVNSFETVRRERRDEYKNFDSIAAQLLSEFVSTTQRIHTEQLPVKIEWQLVFNKLRELNIVNSPASLARKAGIAKTTLHGFIHGYTLPSIQMLLRLAAAADISISGLLNQEFWQNNITTGHFEKLDKLPQQSRRRPRPHNWDEIRRSVQNAITKGEAFTPYRLAKNIGICGKLLTRNIGDLAPELRQSVKDRQKSEQLLFREEIKMSLFQTIESMNSNGIKVSERKTAKTMGVRRQSPFFKEAWTAYKQTKIEEHENPSVHIH